MKNKYKTNKKRGDFDKTSPDDLAEMCSTENEGFDKQKEKKKVNFLEHSEIIPDMKAINLDEKSKPGVKKELQEDISEGENKYSSETAWMVRSKKMERKSSARKDDKRNKKKKSEKLLNCRDLLDILNDEQNMDYDFMNIRESLPLPPKTYTPQVSTTEELSGLSRLLGNNCYNQEDRTSLSLTFKDKASPLPPISRRPKESSCSEEDERLPLQAWKRVDRDDIIDDNQLVMDDDQWCKWLRSSKPASALPQLQHSFLENDQ